MIKHLFKMIWNKKKQNALLISEMLVSFLVLFAVFTLLVFNYQNYKKPMGFSYENVWLVSYNNAITTSNTDSLTLFYETLRQTVKSLPEVKEISFGSNNTPFSGNMIQGGTTVNKKFTDHINLYTTDEHYGAVVNANFLEGRWFTKQDLVGKNKAVVINRSLKEKFFGKGNAEGKLFGDDGDNIKMKVVGVIEDIKVNGDYFSPGLAQYSAVDTGYMRWMGTMLVSVAPNADAAFEGRLYKTLANSMKSANVEIQHLTDMRKSRNYFALVPMIVLIIVAAFLVINVSMGLFGILWYNINKRRGEIGLRLAVGATGNNVTKQLIGEAMVVATFSLIIGTFFAIQFPLLNVFDLSSKTYLIALVLSIVFIYLLVLVCALYPGRQAAAIYPAVALHED
jgi:putative ABC transport system permease protein